MLCVCREWLMPRDRTRDQSAKRPCWLAVASNAPMTSQLLLPLDSSPLSWRPPSPRARSPSPLLRPSSPRLRPPSPSRARRPVAACAAAVVTRRLRLGRRSPDAVEFLWLLASNRAASPARRVGSPHRLRPLALSTRYTATSRRRQRILSLALAMPDEETLREIDALPASPPRFHFEEGHPGLMSPSPTCRRRRRGRAFARGGGGGERRLWAGERAPREGAGGGVR